MNTNNNSSNFWLQVKKEYIDENLEALINYLSKCTTKDRENHDYKLTIDALSDRVEDISNALAAQPLYNCSIPEAECHKYIKLMVAHLLVCQENELSDNEVLAALCNLLEATVRLQSTDTSKKLMNLCINCLNDVDIDTFNVTWSDIKDPCCFYPQVLATKIADTTLKAANDGTVLYYQNKGCLIVDNNTTKIAALNYKDCRQHKKLEQILPSPCHLCVVGNGSDKLSQAASTNILKTDKAYWETIRQMESVRPSATSTKKQRYQVGDLVCVKLIQANRNTINVETIDPKFEAKRGQVFIDKTILGIDRQLILDFFTEKSYTEKEILLTVEVQDNSNFPFILRNAITKYYKDLAEDSNGSEMLAICYDKYSVGYKWLTENGLTLNIMDTENASDDEIMEAIEYVVVQENKKIGKNCVINGLLSENCNNEEFDVEEFKANARKNFLNGFLKWTTRPSENKLEEVEEIPVNIIHHCISALYHDAKHKQETRLRHLKLSMANTLCTLIADTKNAEYLRFELKYLMALVKFAHGDKFNTDLTLEANDAFANIENVKEKLQIIATLNNYNFELQKMQKLPEQKTPGVGDIGNIQKLVEASQTLNGVIPLREIDAIKQAIAKNLFVDDEYESIIDEESEYGEEDDTKEFKTSVVFDPSKTDKPNLKRQMKNILNAVCGFLNSEKGGDLYIGVNDAGEAKGMTKDVIQLYKDKHITEESIDKYRLFIEQAIENAFKDSIGPENGRDITGLLVSTHIETSEKNGEKILRIHISPYEYGVVEFCDNHVWYIDEEKSYIRKSGRTVKMTESLKEQLLERRKKGNNQDIQNIQVIRTAIAQKKCIKLYGYESSSGISDRIVEPYYFKPSINAIVAFDLDRNSNREFKINRFHKIEIIDKKWKNESKHLANPKTDIFHIMESENQKGTKIVLEFDNYVKNLLFEEFPDAKRLEESPKSGERIFLVDKETGKWRLETTVFSYAGITRFYLGLAHRITIVESDQLKEHIRKYISSINV